MTRPAATEPGAGDGPPRRRDAATSVAWPAAATRFLALRLRPGDDLRGELERAFAEAPERAGFVAASVGSLSRLALRHAGRDGADVVEGCFELVGLSGTLSVDGPHLHLLASDPEGGVVGGHLLPGCTVRTTAEIVIALAHGVRFARATDAETGCAELTFDRDGNDRGAERSIRAGADAAAPAVEATTAPPSVSGGT